MPPKRELHNDRWHRVRLWVDENDPKNAWPRTIVYRKLRHHAATKWFHDELGESWEVVAQYLGDKRTTVLNHCVRAGEDALRDSVNKLASMRQMPHFPLRRRALPPGPVPGALPVGPVDGHNSRFWNRRPRVRQFPCQALSEYSIHVTSLRLTHRRVAAVMASVEPRSGGAIASAFDTLKRPLDKTPDFIHMQEARFIRSNTDIAGDGSRCRGRISEVSGWALSQVLARRA